ERVFIICSTFTNISLRLVQRRDIPNYVRVLKSLYSRTVGLSRSCWEKLYSSWHALRITIRRDDMFRWPRSRAKLSKKFKLFLGGSSSRSSHPPRLHCAVTEPELRNSLRLLLT